MKYGYTDKAKDSGDIRFLRITDISDAGNLIMENQKFLDKNFENSKFLVKKGDILMARTGATYGKTLFYNEEKDAVFASFLIKIIFDENILLSRYYWHFTKSNLYWNQANKLVSKSGQPQFNANALKEVIILIPPIKVQKEIVAILDKLDKLVNDISEGLPAEIKARRKQYKYYREKLLTFKKLEK